jgi:hypothetical protein
MIFTGYENSTNNELMRIARDYGSNIAVELAKRLEHLIAPAHRLFEEPENRQNRKTGVKA